MDNNTRISIADLQEDVAYLRHLLATERRVNEILAGAVDKLSAHSLGTIGSGHEQYGWIITARQAQIDVEKTRSEK